MPGELLIHPERISGKAIVFEGAVAAGALPRLAQSLAEGPGELRFKVSAVLDSRRRKVVSCIIEGFAFLICQSTLEAFRHPIAIDDRLVLVDDESELPPIEEESDAEDYLVAGEPVRVLDLVEDAVLLAIPMVPRKPGLEGPGASGKAEKERGASPFAALASLKKKTR